MPSWPDDHPLPGENLVITAGTESAGSNDFFPDIFITSAGPASRMLLRWKNL
jgi:hypothetical protein